MKSNSKRVTELRRALMIVLNGSRICKKKVFFAVAQQNFALCSLFKAVSDAREGGGWGAALVLGEDMAGGRGEGAYDSPRLRSVSVLVLSFLSIAS